MCDEVDRRRFLSMIAAHHRFETGVAGDVVGLDARPTTATAAPSTAAVAAIAGSHVRVVLATAMATSAHVTVRA